MLSVFNARSIPCRALQMTRVGQNRIYAPYMTVYLVISLPKKTYMHRVYMVLANPTDDRMTHSWR
jgi:hypothetical protein